ncbi:MAG: flagellar export protein FliJ [Venatoribacter sp.]
MRRHPRAKRLQIILDMAEREEETLLTRWGQLQRQLTAEQEQRDQLVLYNHEYQQRLSAPGQGPLSGGSIQATLGFMTQIEQALEKQKEKLALLEKQTATAHQAYLEQHGKVQALIKLMDKLDSEHDAEQEKQLQKQADEFANRAASIRMQNK